MGIRNFFRKDQWIARLTISFVFMASAIMKLADFEDSIDLIQEMFDLQHHNARLLLAISILFEIMMAMLVVVRHFQSSETYLILILAISLFIVINGWQIYTQQENCGCFGTMVQMSPVVTLAKNCFLLFLAVSIRKKMSGRNSA